MHFCGTHDYEDILTPETGEVFEVEAEPSNPHYPVAMAEKMNRQVVGHMMNLKRGVTLCYA